LNFRSLLRQRKYRLLYSTGRKAKPGPKGPSRELIEAIVSMKQRNRGIKEIFGDVLSANRPMLKLCKILGFTQSRVPDEPGVVRVTLQR